MKKKSKKSMPGDMFKAFQAKKGMKKKAKKTIKKKSILGNAISKAIPTLQKMSLGKKLAGPMASSKVSSYHDNAQGFIKSAKGMGMSVKSDGSELIAGKQKKAKKSKKMKMKKNDHDADDKKKKAKKK